MRLVMSITKEALEGNDWDVNTLAQSASYTFGFTERTGYTVILGYRLGLEEAIPTTACKEEFGVSLKH
ncbi:MAG: hypothetical protein CL920_20925 [Deltaproteobacteria bacterium]|nr:hypothetical protein [Deltaproteobacteria bacterium]